MLMETTRLNQTNNISEKTTVEPAAAASAAGKAKWRLFLSLIRNTKPSIPLLTIAVVMSMASTVVGLIIPLFTKNLVDGFSLSNLSWSQIGGIGAVFIVQTIASGLSIYMLNRIGQKIVARLRERLWKKLLVLPVSYYDNHRTGETISRMTNDTGIVKSLIAEHTTGFFTGIISIIGSIIVLFYMDWKMTAVMLGVIPVAALFLVPLGRQMFKISKGLRAGDSFLHRRSDTSALRDSSCQIVKCGS